MNKTKGKEVVSRHELLVTPSPKGKLKNIITKTKKTKKKNTKYKSVNSFDNSFFKWYKLVWEN